MATKTVLTNAVAFDCPADKAAEVGKPLVIQLAPVGEYPQWVDDKTAQGGKRKVIKVVDGQAVEEEIDDPTANEGRREVVQKVDEQAIDALISHFDPNKKVLVDADHSSELSTDTRAMAWVVRLFKDDTKGLMAEIEPTSIGAETINGKVYRFVSAAWTLDDDNRPEELVSVGLTNRPNLPVAPMLNSRTGNKTQPGATAVNAEDGVTAKVPSATAKAEENAVTAATPTPNQEPEITTHKPKKETHDMDIRAKLELPAEATDEDVEQAIDALVAKCGVVEQVQNALGIDTKSTPDETVEAVNRLVQNCGDLQTTNADLQGKADELETLKAEKLNNEADTFVAQNEDVIPEEAKETLKEEYKANPEAAQQTVANFRLVAKKAVANAQPAQKPSLIVAKTHVRVENAAAKKPVTLNMKDALAACGGDPEKEIKALEEMADK